MKMGFVELETDHVYPVTQIKDRRFLYIMQNAVLLRLRDIGYLTFSQYQCAEQMLQEQLHLQNTQ